MNPFAVFIPLGPDQMECERAIDLIESLIFHEPRVSLIVIVRDGTPDPSPLYRIELPSTCGIAVLTHPRLNHELNIFGGLCAANLVAFDYISRFRDIGFVVKFDTDSLVISPFSHKIEALFRNTPDGGMAGVLGDSCNRTTRSFQMDRILAQVLTAAISAGTSPRSLSSDEATALKKLGVVSLEQIGSFQRLCTALAPLLHNDFSGMHCQGGAYAVSARLIAGLSSEDILRDPSSWLNLKIGEDQMMGVLCALLGFKAIDFSEVNEVFGVQARGLAHSPAQLLEFGYSIIHSVKTDTRYPEEDVRRFFRSQR